MVLGNLDLPAAFRWIPVKGEMKEFWICSYSIRPLLKNGLLSKYQNV